MVTKRRHAGRQANEAERVPSVSIIKGNPEVTPNSTKHRGKAAGSTAIIKALDNERVEPANEPDIVWTYKDLPRELAKADQVGPRKISHEHLLSFCHGINTFQHGRLLMDARPYFVELWRRINQGELKMSKAEACRRIECTPQWVNAIISGRADERREQREEAKELAKTRNLVSVTELEPTGADWSDHQDDRVHERRESEGVKEEAKPGGLGSAVKLALRSADWSDDQYIKAGVDEVRSLLQPLKQSEPERSHRIAIEIAKQIVGDFLVDEEGRGGDEPEDEMEPE